MLKEIKEYYVDGSPSDDDINEAIGIASYSGFVIKLMWHIPWNGGHYVYISPCDTLEMVRGLIPKSYGI